MSRLRQSQSPIPNTSTRRAFSVGGHMRRAGRKILFASALAFVLLAPTAALAQSAIAGVVRDTTGAVLPGVTVEASSPALIEGARTATTDEAGLRSEEHTSELQSLRHL